MPRPRILNNWLRNSFRSHPKTRRDIARTLCVGTHKINRWAAGELLPPPHALLAFWQTCDAETKDKLRAFRDRRLGVLWDPEYDKDSIDYQHLTLEAYLASTPLPRKSSRQPVVYRGLWVPGKGLIKMKD